MKMFTYNTKKIYFYIPLLLISDVYADQSSFEKTMGNLNKEFRTFQITRKLTKNEKVSAFKFEYPVQGLETDSKQNLRGVTIYVNEDGRIYFVKPMTVENPLPDQKAVNAVINASEKISESLIRFNFSKMDDSQKFGLVSKFASAILARNNGVNVNFELTEEQRIQLNKLFGSKLKIPVQADMILIENFSKEVIQFTPY
jgi:hypothetical protein